jgi:hypothetical protein
MGFNSAFRGLSKFVQDVTAEGLGKGVQQMADGI